MSKLKDFLKHYKKKMKARGRQINVVTAYGGQTSIRRDPKWEPGTTTQHDHSCFYRKMNYQCLLHFLSCQK